MKMDKEKQIQTYMEKLGISREEAEQLFEDDAEDYIGEQGEEMTKNAKEVMRTIHGADSGKKTQPKKNAPRERKENPTKREIIQSLFAVVQNLADSAEITNMEKYISFQIGEDTFELNLVQKRKPKK